MDRLESLGSTLSQITLYDIKSMYNQAKNVVLNVSEIEAKVREATNDEPWGASSTLMQDIANRTFNYPDFNEIMPSIYARFMEKEARQWRQIYKALQLLEYLIKHGSERVVDDARSHVSTIKMLRNFHYIDDKGKDEGLNVRNRSRELVELLSDVEKIRGERRKAKANKHKYTGTGHDGGMSFSSDTGGRYGGFGSDSLGGGGGGSSYGGGGGDHYSSNYGAGSSSGGGGSSGFRDERRPGGFDEYNAGDDEIGVVNSGRTTSPTHARRSVPTRKPSAPAPPPPPAPAPIVDLFGDDDDGFTAPITNNKALPVPTIPAAPVNVIDDDEFAEFQAAPVSPAVPTVPGPGFGKPAAPNMMMDMLATPAPAPAPAYGQTPGPPRTGAGMGMGMGTGMGMGMGGGMGGGGMGMGMGMGMGGGMGGGMGMGMGQQPGHRVGGSISSPPLQPQAPNYSGMAPMAPMQNKTPAQAQAPAASKPAASFDDLWSMSLGSSSKPATPAAGAAGGKSIKDLEKEKAMAGLWGSGGGQKPAAMGNMGMGMGGMGGMGGSSSSSGGIDDLLG
ncbi:ENTH-domain-containing protein [Mycena rebaudengoi]|nr:ENTH-domain-containing protein [Mycena rebaudengoi]